MANIHDSGYKYLFSNRTFFKQLLETFVHEDWVKEADLDQAERLDKSFISDHFKTTESDLIYKVPLKNSEVYVYILLEFQSTSPRFMALRVLHYLTGFYLDFVKAGKRVRKLPPVFPIVLYNGEKRWTAPTNLDELLEQPDLLERFGLRFEYFKIAENEFTREELLDIHNIVSTLFLADAHYDTETVAQKLMDLFKHEPDRQAISLLLNWFRYMSEHNRVEESDVETLHRIYADEEEVSSMLVNALKKERQKFYEEGKQEGLKEVETMLANALKKERQKFYEEGLKEGKQEGLKEVETMLANALKKERQKFYEEGKQEGLKEGEEKRLLIIARTLLDRKISHNDIVEITGLPEEEIRKLEASG